MTDELTAEQLEQLLQMVMLPQPPYLMAGVGLLIGVLCGLTFGRQVQDKLDGWKQDRLPLLPLATAWGIRCGRDIPLAEGAGGLRVAPRRGE